MPSDSKRDHEQDVAVAGTFPASDPPSDGNVSGARAVPPESMMAEPRAATADAVTLRRRFPSGEAAKLALEGLVRDGPVDRSQAALNPQGSEVELSLQVQPEDCQRLRGLLAKA